MRQVPSGGIGYGLLRWARGDETLESQLRTGRCAEISFNYLGQFDQPRDDHSLFALAHEPTGPTESPRATRPYLLDLIAQVQDGCLQLRWIYSDSVHRRETIEYLANQFLQALRELIDHCLSPDAGGFTPSDFPLAQVDEEELSALENALDHLDDSPEP